MINSLVLLILLAATLPCAASGTDITATSSRLELKKLAGLKALFTRLHNRIERQFGGTALNRALLSSHDSYRKVINRRSTREQKQLQSEYSRLLGDWQQFQVVAAYVLNGGTALPGPSYAHSFDAFIDGHSVKVTARSDAETKDRFVARMEMLGYTSKEISEVISGQITLQALKKSDRMRALGYGREVIAAFLEQHYKGHPAAFNATISHKRVRSGQSPRIQAVSAAQTAAGKQLPRQQLEHYVQRYARNYGVDANLVSAIITHESSWRVHARSRAGAIGLMQLMPTTAKALGVDPLNPEQNIEGGVRYLAGLLDMFEGDLDAALVSYNAGPSHAKKWRKGDTILYGETRDYLQRVKQSYARLDI